MMVKRSFISLLSVLLLLSFATVTYAQLRSALDVPDEIEDELKRDPVEYTLSVSETTVVELNLLSEDFDPYLELWDDDETLLAQNDDGMINGEYGSNSVLVFIAQADTRYIVRVRGYSEDVKGDFTLVSKVKDATEIKVGEPVSLTNDDGSVYFWFEGKAGDDLDLLAEVVDYDTKLELFDANGVSLASSDDEVGLNPYISGFSLPADGSYLLILSAYSEEPASDPITVTVRETTIIELALDEPFEAETAYNFFRFTAEAGKTYRVLVRADNPSQLNIEVSLAGNSYNSSSASSYTTQALAIEFEAETDGVYQLAANGQTADYEPLENYTIVVSEVQ